MKLPTFFVVQVNVHEPKSEPGFIQASAFDTSMEAKPEYHTVAFGRTTQMAAGLALKALGEAVIEKELRRRAGT
jgi:hypothetical protein